jgi:hypothetical protein
MEALDLIHISWDEDQGLVSLKQGSVLFNCFGRIQGVDTDAPTVEITDTDFRLLGDEPEQDRTDHSNWGYVMELLKHPRFPLEERLKEGGYEAPPDPYAHLTDDQKAKIREGAIQDIVNQLDGDHDNRRYWAEYVVKDFGLGQCLETIDDDPDDLAEKLGFDPRTGKEIK